MSKKLTKTNSYSVLVKKIQQELSSLEFFVKRRTAEAYWRVGKFIHKHLLEQRERAGYGHTLFERLARDVDRDPTTLSRAVKFYRTYPILAERQELNWNHYKCLITVKDKEERKRLEDKIIEKEWDAQKLQEYLSQKRLVEVLKSDSNKPAPKLDFTRGRLYTYSLVRPAENSGGLLIDLGFRMRREFDKARSLRLKQGDSICVSKNRDKFSFAKTAVAKDELFTYSARVGKVIDGDTLWAVVDTGFGIFIEQKFRLRGIDCAEINTELGQRAKRFVQSRLSKLDFIVVKTYKDSTDKYDRYLTDIFYLADEDDEQRVTQEGQYLNQELLDERLAYVW